MTDYSEMTFTAEFLEHVARTPSQYDATCRGLADEVIRLRARAETIARTCGVCGTTFPFPVTVPCQKCLEYDAQSVAFLTEKAREKGHAAAQARYTAPVTDEEVRRLWAYAFDLTSEPTENEMQTVRDAVTRWVEIRTISSVPVPTKIDWSERHPDCCCPRAPCCCQARNATP